MCTIKISTASVHTCSVLFQDAMPDTKRIHMLHQYRNLKFNYDTKHSTMVASYKQQTEYVSQTTVMDPVFMVLSNHLITLSVCYNIKISYFEYYSHTAILLL